MPTTEQKAALYKTYVQGHVTLARFLISNEIPFIFGELQEHVILDPNGTMELGCEQFHEMLRHEPGVRIQHRGSGVAFDLKDSDGDVFYEVFSGKDDRPEIRVRINDLDD